MSDLSDRQHRFIDEYLIDQNATQAAIRAGYSPQTCRVMGPHLAKQPQIRAAIDAKLAKQQRRTEVTADRVLLELSRLAFADARTLHHPNGSLKSPQDWDDDTAAQIAGIEVSRTSTRTSAGTAVRAARMPWAQVPSTLPAASGIGSGRRLDPGGDASGRHADQAVDTGVDVQVEESTVKVKRYDKVKALEILAKHTGVLGGEVRAQAVIDPMRVARMDDRTLEQALALARQMAALVDA